MAQRNPEDAYRHETENASPFFRSHLIESTFAPNRAIADTIHELALDTLGEEADALMQMTRNNSFQSEFAKLIYVTPARTILIPRTAVKGNSADNHVAVTVEVGEYPERRWMAKELRQSRFVGTVMHTHKGFDLPPSPIDLGPLFYRDDNIAAMTSVFVITNSKGKDNEPVVNKIVIFRGKNTPQWTQQKTQEHVDSWMQNLQQRVNSRISPFMSSAQQYWVNGVVQSELLRELIYTYDLRCFVSLDGGNTVKLQTA